MELREFAEQVLFATTLAEKIRPPGALTDDQPGPAREAPAAPGRPPELRFKPTESRRTGFPGLQHLEQTETRGRLLHFFANHELLATELMALVLLRFPDAPTAFRRGVLQTLVDEQEHTRWYCERMRACGIEFGELPVSGFFWRAVAPMQSPMDYVAGLSLTFEQANLDFARDFAERFGRVGDTETATLLDRIYHDEIAHVAYGLKWFRRWKNPDESDWDAFCRQLKLPLTPRRARGFVLNPSGRIAAGLEPAFIAELEIYSHSKGRTPDVLLFNPFAEAHLAHGPAFTPRRHQVALAHDLACLPQFLAHDDDVVLVPRRPRREFLAALKRVGLPVPEFVETNAAASATSAVLPPAELTSRKLGRLRPWAWGPDSEGILRPLLPQVSGELPPPCWDQPDRLGRLHSKTTAADFLRHCLLRPADLGDIPRPWGDEPWLCDSDQIGVTADSVDAVLAAVRRIRERGHHRVVVKATLGFAGAQALRLWEPEILESQRRWLAQATRDGREVIVEPWLERVLDFSLHLDLGEDGPRFRGFTTLLNDARGQYQGNVVAPHFDRRLPAAVARWLATPTDVVRRVLAFYEAAWPALAHHLADTGYRGPLGIDAFVYRDNDGRCRLKPIVEFNARYTMGRVALELMAYACPGHHGVFRLVSRAQAHAAGHADLAAFGDAMTRERPPRLEGHPVPRVREGFLCLTDPTTAESVLAVWEVHRSAPPASTPFPPADHPAPAGPSES